ncbi:membrane bound O-acyl transferase family-domain-containing protein [Annulohypoxylon truncatum]|uniref:membrane bound O-acyl transferase family-domain-containing protein n=1 Tax=Annulohypoxylon truncatum TaxID=327061 RepID=UPI00200820B6|nr:membrane bound O-acyl transferase family-domain-containing protein [Annulohypoxylon truncatum]KAI1212104.1 membrane bound O-acyl transferase family-domain-containing protein [Annulohypoxylon truncatum]
MSYHPLFDSLGVALLTVSILGFTPTSSLLRIACLPILGSLTWHCLLTCPDYIARSSWASAVGGYTLSLFFHYLDVAVLSRWSSENRGKSTTPGAFSEVAYRMKFGFSTLFSWRFINTPDQVRNIPPLKEELRSSKARFLGNTAAIIIVCYLLLDAMDASSDTVPEFYSIDKISMLARIQDVSLEELIMRFFAAVGLGVGLVSFQRGVYSIAAFFCVAIGLSSPADWPPYNGSVLKISSLRYFWSTFWHQTNTHRLHTFSSFFIHDVLRIRKNTKLARFLRVWVVFFISGVIHVAIDSSAGIPVQDSGALRFFLIQPLGIIVEDVVGPYLSPLTSEYRIVQRCLGFIWVGLWMAWTAPGYLYPIINKSDPGDGGVVPVSIISYVKRLIEEL